MSDQPRSPATESEVPARRATYRQVFAEAEFRGIFSAAALSWFGDYVARAAITALVFQLTHSPLTSAAAFALSYLPWLAGGPVLAALADRYPYRRVMIICDLARMVLVGVVALPQTPIWLIFVLLFATAMLSPPFEAARSALMPQVLSGERYVLAIGVQSSSLQAFQILGYVTGGLLASINANIALGLNAATFGCSAILLGLMVRRRPSATAQGTPRHILRETGEGISIVFGRPVLRAIALVVLAGLTFIAVPEGLAAGWAAVLNPDGRSQGLIMAAAPVGLALGGIVLPRAMSSETRRRALRPLVILAPLALVPALLDPPLPVVLGMVALAGFMFGGFNPLANALFVQSLPASHRARAFGVMAAGMQLTQGAALLVAGSLTQIARVPYVIGAWCAGGALLMVVASAAWPAPDVIDAAIAETKASNDAAAKLAG
ncbi:MFS transporter [Longispora fulva]|uniref:MFS family permease n=1 Tax=Longispora fulva TaxID=619741 RepID=A0A8J7GXA4_9ACTN|nr:MFS transporter [Longispora fulva]MBG6140744.1 MFS family permease [Longispora fulva]GIG60992.1 MFS transporter [Longispora fulva]